MPNTTTSDVFDFLGTQLDDSLNEFEFEGGTPPTTDEATKVNGLEGDDTVTTEGSDDLAAGDMVGDEWTFVDGQWVYNAADVIVSDYGADKSFNDTITTGAGDDVLLGNGGHDKLYAGDGNDYAYGGNGNDLINLENGNDYAEAGYGDDKVNAGHGDDVVYGDVKGENLLAENPESATTFSQLAENGSWTMTDTFGQSTIAQSVATEIGETYTIAFNLAANFAAGHATGMCPSSNNLRQRAF
ncbi:MAG: hypothetical protein P8Q99_07665 [Paracoccaceae bacterium]|nr:hypothetical protein [Paracoccaceae bacterium]